MFIGCPFPESPRIDSIFSAFSACYPPDYYFTGEAHDFFEILCVLKGEAEITADERILRLQANQAILHPPLEFHRVRTFGDAPLEVAVFSFSAQNAKEKGAVLCLDKALQEEIRTLIQEKSEIFEYYPDPILVAKIKPNQTDAARRFQNRLESLFLRFQETSDAPLCLSKSIDAKRYAEILKVLKKNLSQPLTIAKIAKECNMSPSGLKKTVHNYSGMGIITLYNELKLQTACNLLRDNQSIQEISYALGFENPNYFSTFFKRKFGVPPTEWRKQQNETDTAIKKK